MKSYVVDAFRMSKWGKSGFAGGAASAEDAGAGARLEADAAAGTGTEPTSTRAREGWAGTAPAHAVTRTSAIGMSRTQFQRPRD